ncbi:MAG: hypothetical protein IH986_03780 [Planctomycetes bacterium]|nr:hypothetical protein [Planctomycetota bacterium]
MNYNRRTFVPMVLRAFAAPWLIFLATTAAASDDALLAALVTDATGAGKPIILEPGRHYKLDNPWDLSGLQNMTVIGNGAMLVSFFDEDKPRPVIEMTGSRSMVIRDLVVAGGSGSRAAPSCAVLMARTQLSPGAEGNSFFSLRSQGTFTVANIVNIGAEICSFHSAILTNDYDGGANYLTAAWATPELRDRIGAEFWGGTTWGGAKRAPDGVHSFFGGRLGVYGRTGKEVNVLARPGAHMITFTGTHFSNMTADRTDRDAGGLCVVEIGAPGFEGDAIQADSFSFFNCWMEASGAKNLFRIHQRDTEINLFGGRGSCLEDPIKYAGKASNKAPLRVNNIGFAFVPGHAGYPRGTDD